MHKINFESVKTQNYQLNFALNVAIAREDIITPPTSEIV